MSKSTNFTGQPIFGQLIKFIDRQHINTIARKNGTAIIEKVNSNVQSENEKSTETYSKGVPGPSTINMD